MFLFSLVITYRTPVFPAGRNTSLPFSAVAAIPGAQYMLIERLNQPICTSEELPAVSWLFTACLPT